MSDDRSQRRQSIGSALVWVALIATVLAAVAGVAGGFRFDVGGLRISVQNPVRPIIVAVVCGVLGLRLGATRLAGVPLEVIHAEVLWRRAALISAAIAIAVTLTTFSRGALFAGGADSSGYLSQARLWASGTLTRTTPLAYELSLTHGQHPFTPLGYVPAPDYGAIVPSYPPGLPMLMGLARVLGGDEAELWVVPLCAGAAVFIAFLLGRRLAGPETGIFSAAATAVAPIFLYQSMQSMSDVPAAAWWSLAVLLFTLESRIALVAGGCAAAVACAIRPNLFAMLPVLLLCGMWWTKGDIRTRITRSVWFALPVVVAAFGIAWLQRTLFGAATMSGYGSVSSLFAFDHVIPNLARYPRWLLDTHWPFLLLAVLAPLAIRRGAAEGAIDRGVAVRMTWSALIFFCALQAFYLLYLVFDDWVYIRFILPALPWLLVSFAIVVTTMVRRLPPTWRGVVSLCVIVLLSSWGVGRARGVGAFNLFHSEQRYLEVATFVRGLPPDSAFVAVQHSGSLAYYTDVGLLRWDWIEPAEIDKSVAELTQRGRRVFAVLEDWEEAQFRARFVNARVTAELRSPLFVAGNPAGITVRVYQLGATTTNGAATAVIERPPTGLRIPSRPGAPDPAACLASADRLPAATARSCAARRSPNTYAQGT